MILFIAGVAAGAAATVAVFYVTGRCYDSETWAPVSASVRTPGGAVGLGRAAPGHVRMMGN